MNKKMQRNPFLDKIIDDVITPTHSFSFDGYHTPKTADDAKPIILEYKEGLRKYKEFYEDLLEIMKAHPELKPYVFSAEDAMALQEETRNLEILALSKKQCIYYQEEEPDGGNANIWIR